MRERRVSVRSLVCARDDPLSVCTTANYFQVRTDALRSGVLGRFDELKVPSLSRGERALANVSKKFARNHAVERLGFRSTQWTPVNANNIRRPFTAIARHLR